MLTMTGVSFSVSISAEVQFGFTHTKKFEHKLEGNAYLHHRKESTGYGIHTI